MKRVLVTGGAGFIGSNLIRSMLAQGGYYVYCIDNFDAFYAKERKESNIKDFLCNDCFHLIQDDIRNINDHTELGSIDAIIHLAAKAGVRPSIQDPFLYQSVNVGGTQALLEFARKREIKQFLFASSSSVYGLSPNAPWNENEQVFPISPYACTKHSAEMLGHAYSHLYKIRFIALRFFTVYGPAQRPDLAIYKFFDCMLHKRPIPVFGDGESARDYTYINDVVKAIIAAIDYCGSNFEIINIGNNRTITLNNLIRTIELVCESSARIQYHPEQAGDVPLTYADIRKAAGLLKYSPSTNLLPGLSNFYDWYKKTIG
jgi:UDP-glucuronate 4-epimerase